MGTRAFLTIKLNRHEVHAYSQLDGDDIAVFLKQLKDSEIPLDYIVKATELRLENALYYTLDEIETMFQEFSESQKALDALWESEMPEKHQVLNAVTQRQWDSLYPTLSSNALHVFKALSLKELTLSETFMKTPLIKFNDEEIQKLKSYSEYIYEIDLNENLWTISESGEITHAELVTQ